MAVRNDSRKAFKAPRAFARWKPAVGGLLTALLTWTPGVAAQGERWPEAPLSEWELYQACSTQPSSFAAWFPPNHLKAPLRKRAPDSPDSADRLAVSRCWAGAVLRSYDEPVLAQGSTEVTYRAIWSPSLAAPVVIRILRMPDGTYRAVTKRDVSVEGKLTGKFSESVTAVAASDFETVQAAAERAGCWTSGNTCHAELSDPYFFVVPGQVLALADGETWSAEGARKGEHWGVQVHSPRGGPFMQLCLSIVRAAHADGWLTTPGGGVRRPKPEESPDGGS